MVSGTSKSDYAKFATRAPDLPVFLEPGYLDAATVHYGDWDVLLYRKGKGPFVGAFPYFLKRKYGVTYSVAPPLCKHVGPYFLPEYRAQAAGLRWMAEHFPQMGYAEISCPVEIEDWLPFHWNGWTQTTRYTFQIDRTEGAQFAQKRDRRTRKRLEAAASELTISHELSIEAFYQLVEEVFDRQGRQVPYSLAHLREIDRYLRADQRCKLFVAHDDSGNLHGARYLIWDRHRAYPLISGFREAFRNQNAGYLLHDHCIRHTFEQLGLSVYDFEGSMIRGVAEMNKKMGGSKRNLWQLLSCFLYTNPLVRAT